MEGKKWITRALCYRLEEPFVINAGTPYEKKRYTFLERYVGAETLEELEAEVAALNEKAEGMTYYLKEQENIF